MPAGQALIGKHSSELVAASGLVYPQPQGTHC